MTLLSEMRIQEETITLEFDLRLAHTASSYISLVKTSLIGYDDANLITLSIPQAPLPSQRAPSLDPAHRAFRGEGFRSLQTADTAKSHRTLMRIKVPKGSNRNIFGLYESSIGEIELEPRDLLLRVSGRKRIAHDQGEQEKEIRKLDTTGTLLVYRRNCIRFVIFCNFVSSKAWRLSSSSGAWICERRKQSFQLRAQNDLASTQCTFATCIFPALS